MTLIETQELMDMHSKADRILKLIRANALRLEYSKSKGVVNDSTAIRIRQNERLEYIYDDLICKIADVAITSRKVNV
jgi:hypothetical protein